MGLLSINDGELREIVRKKLLSMEVDDCAKEKLCPTRAYAESSTSRRIRN